MAIPANADPNTGTAGCTVQGAARTSPPVPITGDANGGAGGGYTFSQGALNLNCAGVINGSVEVDSVAITSKGVYHNTVCGTGSAAVNSGQPTPPPTVDTQGNTVTGVSHILGVPANQSGTWATEAADKDLDYSITFAGGQGVFSFTPHGTGHTTGGGVISIQATPDPGQPNTSTNECTSGFAVAGAIAGQLS